MNEKMKKWHSSFMKNHFEPIIRKNLDILGLRNYLLPGLAKEDDRVLYDYDPKAERINKPLFFTCCLLIKLAEGSRVEGTAAAPYSDCSKGTMQHSLMMTDLISIYRF